MLDLLQTRDAARTRAREVLRMRVREDLRRHLTELLPGSKVIVFGSLTGREQFHRNSDIDLALEQLPEGWSIYGLTGELTERMGRPVDVVLLGRSRLAGKIRREGEAWTL